MEEYTNYLVHHGVKGQRWGVRRYQNPDGSLTSEGKSRLNKYKSKEYKRLDKKYDKRISRLESKIEKKKKLGKNIKKTASKHAYLTGRKFIEKTALNKMSYNDMIKEKRAVGRDIVIDVLGSIATIPLTMATGGATPIVGIIPSPSYSKEVSRGVRMNTRIRRNPITGEVLLSRYKRG